MSLIILFRLFPWISPFVSPPFLALQFSHITRHFHILSDCFLGFGRRGNYPLSISRRSPSLDRLLCFLRYMRNLMRPELSLAACIIPYMSRSSYYIVLLSQLPTSLSVFVFVSCCNP